MTMNTGFGERRGCGGRQSRPPQPLKPHPYCHSDGAFSRQRNLSLISTYYFSYPELRLLEMNRESGYSQAQKHLSVLNEINFYFCRPLKKVRCLRGLKEQFAKLSYGVTCTEGSNPSLTARGKLLIDNC